jgi:hypothetical protein
MFVHATQIRPFESVASVAVVFPVRFVLASTREEEAPTRQSRMAFRAG